MKNEPETQIENPRFWMVYVLDKDKSAYGVNSYAEYLYFRDVNIEFKVLLMINPYFIDFVKIRRTREIKTMVAKKS